jgi:hypothetical protein
MDVTCLLLICDVGPPEGRWLEDRERNETASMVREDRNFEVVTVAAGRCGGAAG